MNVTHHISASSQAQNTTPAQAPSGAAGGAQGGAGTALDQLLAFLNLLTGQGADAATVDGAANNAASAGVNAASTTEINSQKSGRSLTADLSSATVSGTQDSSGNTPDLVSQLASKFDALAAAGPVSDDALAQFRDNAIGFLKSKGLDESKIDKTLVDLSAMLGDKLSTAQAAQLALPAFSWATAPGQLNNAGSLAADNTGSLSVSSNPRGGAKAPAQGSPQAGDGQGHDKGAANGAGQNGDATPATGHASGKAPQTNTRGADTSQQVDAGSANTQGRNQIDGDARAGGIINANTGNNAAGSAATPQGAAANTFAAAPADGFDGGDGSSGKNFSSGQQSSGGDTGAGAAGVPLQQASLQSGGPAPAQNFVNYMSNGPQGASPAMTQMVALQIKHNAAAGTDTFSMQLDPAELGRLDIKLKFDKTGSVTAHVTADKPETLALLQKDAPQLHRLLQQAGLTADNNALSFDLRQQGQQNSGNSGQGGNSFSASGGDAGTIDAPIQAKLAVASPGYISQSGVNIVV